MSNGQSHYSKEFYICLISKEKFKESFTLIGLPLLILNEQNVGLIAIPVVGVMLIRIGAMAVYNVGIESKYQKRDKEQAEEKFKEL
ncbi:MAG: hypothetical protein IJA07_01215 [Agathobacter sp.]|nr:hypothetical protein [Agathobacter sp.]